MFSAGIIQTDPNKNIKVSRKLETEKVVEEEFPVQLMEVKIEDAPNVLTNDPEFFAIKKGKNIILDINFLSLCTFQNLI